MSLTPRWYRSLPIIVLVPAIGFAASAGADRVPERNGACPDGEPFAGREETCHRYALAVSGSIRPAFTRSYAWELGASYVPGVHGPAGTAADPLLLAPDQTYHGNIVLTPAVTGSTDGDFRIEGEVTIGNPTPVPVDVRTVLATLVAGAADPIDLDVSCEAELPVVLTSGASLGCTVRHDVAGAVDGEVLVEAVTTADRTDHGRAGLPFTFDGLEPSSVANATVDLVDDRGTPDDPSDDRLVAAVAHDAIRPVLLVVGIRFEECGDNAGQAYVRTVGLRTGEGEPVPLATEQATMYASVPCRPLGCTLTQGYWKTHDGGGWALLDADRDRDLQAAREPFWAAGSWHDEFWTAPKGNVFHILARQYMAARLNVLNGASPERVEDALLDAETFFDTHTVSDAAGLEGQDRQSYVFLAEHLEAYNSGLLGGGPPRCDEDGGSTGIH